MKKLLPFLLGVLILNFSAKSGYSQTWQWATGSTTGFHEGVPIALDQSGNVFVAGANTSDDSMTLDGLTLLNPLGALNYQVFVTKFDPTGHIKWLKGTQGGSAYIYSLATDREGSAIVFGSFQDPIIQVGAFTLTNGSGNPQAFLAKYDSSGNVLWAVKAGETSWSPDFICGWVYIIQRGGVITDTAGNIYAVSNYTTHRDSVGSHILVNTDSSGSTDDIVITKYNSSGTLQWATNLGGSMSDDAFGITLASTGSLYITGVFSSPTFTVGSSVITNSSTNQQTFIAEISTSGTPLWAVAATNAPWGSLGAGLTADKSGNIYLTGGFRNDSITFGSTTIRKQAPYSTNYLSLFALQLSCSSHEVTWSKSISCPTSNICGYSIGYAKKCGQIWVCGTYLDSANIDGHMLQKPALSYDPTLLAEYELLGTNVNYTALQSGGEDEESIAVNDSGDVFITGDLAASEISFMTIGSYVLSTTAASGNELLFIGKYTNPDTVCLPLGIIITSPAERITIYPNPANEELQIDNVPNHATYMMLNMMGAVVMQGTLEEGSNTIFINRLTPGIYAIKIAISLPNGNDWTIRKMVKE